LRALDRTGKPCKRWTKAGFTLKSFTGVTWTVPTWAAPKFQQLPPVDTATATASENASVTTESADKMEIDQPPPPLPPAEEQQLQQEQQQEIPTLALPQEIAV
jgi:hypothetical protein